MSTMTRPSKTGTRATAASQASVSDVEIATPTGTIRTTFTMDSAPNSASSGATVGSDGLQSPVTPFTPADLDVSGRVTTTAGEQPPAYQPAAVNHRGEEILTSAVYDPAAQHERSKLFHFKGNSYTAQQVDALRERLDQAVQDGELPQYDTLMLSAQDVLGDYFRLLQMRKIRASMVAESNTSTDSSTSTCASLLQAELINFAAHLANREDTFISNLAEAATTTRVNNLLANTAQDGHIYALVQQALRDAIRNQAADGRHGVTSTNMEQVLEEIFGVIEASFLDAAGPLRLNNRALQQTNVAIDQHVNAIGQHVNAISGHVGSLGGQIGAMGENLHSVGNHVNVLGTQINVLQTVINLLPGMIQQVVQRVLGEMVSDSLAQGLAQATQHVLGPLIVAQIEQAQASATPAPSSPSKLKRGCFLFKKSNKKDGKGEKN
ncbi:hypothetical protein Micbo1qcDRAFT_170744 [Microdochium bolleyi]|uniref:Uncharacterized protein n=1 Tax=Microdochium bolleyi TaxID=196109 RepID=A0A136JIL2_9PEZI|nr:hypothetical protein Micbo1qcDRAFT_170744 [Microdochium bolleyi]